jgi:hypothetical protein
MAKPFDELGFADVALDDLQGVFELPKERDEFAVHRALCAHYAKDPAVEILEMGVREEAYPT